MISILLGKSYVSQENINCVNVFYLDDSRQFMLSATLYPNRVVSVSFLLYNTKFIVYNTKYFRNVNYLMK